MLAVVCDKKTGKIFTSFWISGPELDNIGISDQFPQPKQDLLIITSSELGEFLGEN